MIRWLVALLVCLLPWLAQADVGIPPLQHRVTDLTGTLTSQQQSELEANLAAFEARKGSQIAILMLPTTQPEDIAQYSIRVVEAWKLGRKGVDDGVLVLLAKDDHKSRIEVGYGLEGALNDATAKRIVSEVMRPHLTQGDFYGGLLAGVNKIESVIDGEPLPEPVQRSGQGGFDANYIFAVFVAAMVLGGLLRALLGGFVGGLVTGGLVGILLWVLGAGLIFAVFLGIMAFFMTMARGRGFPAGFGGGGFGGGSTGGGFSGGGGGFGGGGASGDW
jgi:uncharacterized protein